MLNLFKKKIPEKELTIPVFEVELIGSVLAYEIARSDGEISDDEATLLLGEIKKISEKVGKDEKEILKLIENRPDLSEDNLPRRGHASFTCSLVDVRKE